MSYTYLQELEAVSSADYCWDTDPCALLKLSHIVGRCCCNANATDCCHVSRSGMMSALSMEHPGAVELTSCAGDSPAKTLVPPVQTMMLMDSNEDWRESILACGTKWLESLKRFPPLRCSSKTHPISALRDCTSSCNSLMRWGITQGGVSLGLNILAQTTAESACGYLPTPTCHNAKEGAYPAEYTRKSPTLAACIGGKVNPRWNEQRMGFPVGWTNLEPLAMHKTLE
jgi:hypothetical protein